MKVDFEKQGGLIPAVIQDAKTEKVLMLGYMNQEALEKTEREGIVTFLAVLNNVYGLREKLLIIFYML